MINKITSAAKAMVGAVVLLLVFTGTAMAQDKVIDGSVKLTGYLKTQLSLNDSQYTKVKDVNRVYLQKAKESYASNASKLDKAKKLKALEEERDIKLQSVLTKDQYKIFIANRGENSKKLKEAYDEAIK